MKQFLFLYLIFPSILLSQVQIGSDIIGENPDDQSGWSIELSADGNILAIGAPTSNANGNNSGQVRMYQNQSGSWVQIGQAIDGEDSGDESGKSVSLSSNGNIVAIGAPLNDGLGNDSGHVRVYENIAGTWTQIGDDIDAETGFNRFGTAVSLSSNGTMVAVGAPFNSGNGSVSGHVRVFENVAGTWTQVGDDIDGESSDDFSGEAVSLSSDGGIVAVGAPKNNGNGNDSGHVRVFKFESGAWVQIGDDIDGMAPNNQSGSSVHLSADGNIVAIGATFNNQNGSSSGHVRVFENQSGSWVQLGQSINGEFAGDLSGWAVSLSADANYLAISSPGHSGSRGVVRIYRYHAGSWLQIGDDIDGETIGDFYGRSVHLSPTANEVAIGANRNSDDAGHVRVFDLSSILSTDEFVFNNFSLYPNPAKDIVAINLTNGLQLQEISVYNSLGQYVFTSYKAMVSTSSLSSGFYFVEITTNRGKATKKLLVH